MTKHHKQIYISKLLCIFPLKKGYKCNKWNIWVKATEKPKSVFENQAFKKIATFQIKLPIRRNALMAVLTESKLPVLRKNSSMPIKNNSHFCSTIFNNKMSFYHDWSQEFFFISLSHFWSFKVLPLFKEKLKRATKLFLLELEKEPLTMLNINQVEIFQMWVLRNGTFLVWN